MNDTSRQRYLKRYGALKAERSSWVSHWQELAENLQPRRSRFLTSETNRGGKRNEKIINLTPLKAAAILASGMMAGITSPARKWFKLTVADPSVAGARGVRTWLDVVETKLFEVFARSNIYSALTLVYMDLGVHGTAVLYVEDDAKDVLRAYVFPVGSYCLANSDRLQVDTVYRELSMTVAQLLQKFGRDACSARVREMADRGDTEVWVAVLHVVEPNTDRDPRYIDNRNMAYRSVWMEVDTGDHSAGFLRQSGFEDFPAMPPRWSLTGEDVYGHSPGMDGLGDAKTLQVLERESAKAVAKMVSPPMKGPSSMRNQRISLVAGDMTYSDSTASGERFEPAMKIEPATIEVIEEKIRQHERRIESAFYADLFVLLLREERSNVTAEEVRARNQEKMLQLGPVLERLNDELLDPLIDRAFSIMLAKGHFPPPPEELQGQPIRVEYTSILAQAQKLLGTTAVERLASFVTSLANVAPDVLDKIDFDKLVEDYAEMLGVPPDELRAEDVVQQLREQRAQQQQAAAQGQAMLEGAKGARDLASAGLEGDNALGRLMGALGPSATAAGGGR